MAKKTDTKTSKKTKHDPQQDRPDDAKIIGREHDKISREVREAMEIKKRGTKVVNREEGTDPGFFSTGGTKTKVTAVLS